MNLRGVTFTILVAAACLLASVPESAVSGTAFNSPIDVLAANAAQDSVAFAASAFSTTPPAGVLATDPAAWPALVGNCTDAYLNSSVASAAAPVVVRIAVPAGQAVALNGCRTPAGGPLWHVRLVLAMERTSAIALNGWQVEVGGVTVEGAADAHVLAEALVVVRGSSIVAGSGVTSGARAKSSLAEDDVHALSFAPTGGAAISAEVSGLGIVVAKNSVVRAQHDGAGMLYASACGVRSGPSGTTAQSRASLAVDRLRIVVADWSSVVASTTHTIISPNSVRRAHVATVQALTGANVSVTTMAVAVVGGSSVRAAGDVSCAAAGLVANSQTRAATATAATTMTARDLTLIAAGPNTSVAAVTARDGRGTSAMGLAAFEADALVGVTHARIYVAGRHTTVSTAIGNAGDGASAAGVAASTNAEASMSHAEVFAMGPAQVTVTVGVDGRGASAMGAAAVFRASASLHFARMFAVNETVVSVHVGGYGGGVAAIGAAAHFDGAKATMTHADMYVAGPNTGILVLIDGSGGSGAAALGVAASAVGSVAAMRHCNVRATGRTVRIEVRVGGGGGAGVTAAGVAAFVGSADMVNTTVHVAAHNATVTAQVAGSGRAVSALGLAGTDAKLISFTDCAMFLTGPGSIVSASVTAINSYGIGVAATGIALSLSDSKASVSNVTIFVGGPDTVVRVYMSPGNRDSNGITAMGIVAHSRSALTVSDTVMYAAGPSTTVQGRGTEVGAGSVFGIAITSSATLTTTGVSLIRCVDRVEAVASGGIRAANVWSGTANPGVRFTELDPGACTGLPEPSPLSPPLPATAAPSTDATTGTETTSRTRTGSLRHTRTANRSTITVTAAVEVPPLPVSVSHPCPATTTVPVVVQGERTGTLSPLPPPPPPTAQASESVAASTTRPAATVSASAAAVAAAALHPPAPTYTRIVPQPVLATAGVVSGVLLPSSASKPMANTRVLHLVDSCLTDGGVLDEPPGEWPSDYAVVVARWDVGSDSDGDSAAAGRGAGAAVAVALAMAACAAAVLVATRQRGGAPTDAAVNADAAKKAETHAPKSSPHATAAAVAVLVSAAYLVPNALEAAVVALVATGAGSTAGLAAALAAAAMLTATVPFFAAPVMDPDAGVAARVAAFFHPVVVHGLRTEGSRLLRAHAILDVAAACVIAAAGGITEAGSRLGGSCVAAALVMATAATALTAYYALVRPFRARLEVAVSAAQAAILAVLCWMTVAVVATEGASVSPTTLDAAGNAAEMLTFAAPVVLLASEVWLRYCSAATAAADTGDCSPRVQEEEPATGRPLLAVPVPQLPTSDSHESHGLGRQAEHDRHRNPLAKPAQ